MGTAVAESQFLTVAEAARLLRVSEATIYRRCADETLPHVRLGGIGSIRIPSNFLTSTALAVVDPAERGETSGLPRQSSSPAHAGKMQ